LDENDVGASLGERNGNGLANASGAACHEGCFALEGKESFSSHVGG